MSDESQMNLNELEVDRANLYREEIFTDLRVASIRRLLPIKPDGSDDPARTPMFLVETQLMSQHGPLPVQARVDAATLEEAVDRFPAAIQEAVDRMVEQARELRRQETSRIITPTGPPDGKIILG